MARILSIFPIVTTSVSPLRDTGPPSIDREAVEAAGAPAFGETLLGATRGVMRGVPRLDLGQRNEAAVLVDDQTFAVGIFSLAPEQTRNLVLVKRIHIRDDPLEKNGRVQPESL